MNSSSQQRSTLHVLRGILRHLRSPPKAKTTVPPVTRQYILSQYRASQNLEELKQQERLRRAAEEYYQLLKDVAERAELHRLDAGAEEQFTPKEMSRRAAARAGLQLPDLNPNLE